MEGVPTGWKITMSSRVNVNLIPRPRNRRLREVLSRVYLRSPNEGICPCRDCMDKKRRRIQSAKQVSRMLEAQSMYKPSSPQPPTVKRRRLRLSSVPLVDLRATSLPGTSVECEQVHAHLSSSSAGSDFANPHRLLSTSGVWFVSEGMEGASTVRIKHLTSTWEGHSRFPKLDECAHFHYEFVELGSIQVCLCEETQRSNIVSGVGVGSGSSKSVSSSSVASQSEEDCRIETYPVQITSLGKTWIVRRTFDNFCLLDEQLHRCIYDRKFSILPELNKNAFSEDNNDSDDSQNVVRNLLSEYLSRFSTIAGSLISCGPILNWLELDNRGNRLIVTDDSAINTPAVAAAYVVKRYLAQASDEISFEVGDMISVIDMPPPEESIWWRGKKGFEVGFFPCECVEVIGDKIPQSINIPNAPTKPVLRKHGKLISFFRSFILSRPSRRKLKQRGILKERVFGCDLGEHLLNSQQKIPLVLSCCSQFIEEHGIVDGIYRLSGVTSNIQKLRNSFDEDRVPNLNDSVIVQDIHCVASLLKMYFRELPNPLLTYQLYDKFVSAVQSDESVRLLNMRDVVQQLPPPHYRTLEYLIRHLARVASYGAETGMTPKNVAIVWAPNLLRSKELEIGSVAALQVVGVQAIVTEYLIRYVDLIFNEKLLTFNTSVRSSGTPKKTRPKSLAISTPTKLLSLEEARSRALSTSAQVPQKYIEVGGGPATLPSKYHTVIDLPHRKRDSAKLKKSPLGWKSFFSKGKQTSKGKIEVLAQSSVISNENQVPIILAADKQFSVVDSAIGHPKPLRSVKSAESLVSSHSHHGSDICDINKRISMTEGNGIALVPSLATSRSSPHTHLRSLSHDSYFDLLNDVTNDDMTENEDDYLEDKSDSNDLEKDDVKEEKDSDDMSQKENDQREMNESDTKSPKKHRWKQGEPISPKLKLTLKEKLKQAFSSPPSTRKVDDESTKFDPTKPTSIVAFKDKLCYSLSPEFNQRGVLSGIDNLGVDDDEEQGETMMVCSSKGKENEDGGVVDEKSGGKVTVERYGSEKTVIVEVHATQESEDEENREINFNFAESPISPCEFGSPTSVLATISDNETLSMSALEEMSDDVLDTSFAEYTSDPDALQPDSEISTPKSFVADILDTETFSALAFSLKRDLVDETENIEDGVENSTDEFGDKYKIDDEGQETTVIASVVGQLELRSPLVTASSELSTPSPMTTAKIEQETSEKHLFGYSVLVDELESGKSGSEEEPTPSQESNVEVSLSLEENLPTEVEIAFQDVNVRSSVCSRESFPSTPSEHFSPMDESKRKFESEIGRDILRERKMKLELEKIQFEQRLLSPPVDVSRRSNRKSTGSESNDEEMKNVIGLQVDDDVELRRCKHETTFRGDEAKRNSEPVFQTKEENKFPESKRFSEPQIGKKEEKTNVKELLSRFEPLKTSSAKAKPTSPVSIFADVTVSTSKCVDKPPPGPNLLVKSKSSEKCDSGSSFNCVMSMSCGENSKPCSMMADSLETDSARRERIDKYKEERRAQLREKIRSESFRMNKEEKTEYMARLKTKTTSPLTTPDGDEIVSFGSLRKTRVSTNFEFPPPSPRRVRASLGEINVSSSDVVSPTRICEGFYGSSKLKSPKKSPRVLWPTQTDVKKDDLSTSNIPLLRSVPGRRSLPSVNHDDSSTKRSDSPSKSVRRRASLMSNNERSSTRDSSTKIKDIAVDKVTSLTRPVGFSTSQRKTKVGLPRGESTLSELKSKTSPRMDVKSYPVESGLLKLGKKSTSSLTSPRKIRDVAALFEKESSSTSTTPTKNASRGGHLSVISTRARYISQNPENNPDQGPEVISRGKANQYLSAV